MATAKLTGLGVSAKPIEGYPNYCITIDGRVYSRRSGRFVKTFIPPSQKYLRVSLYRIGEGKVPKSAYVHLLVLKHFGPPRPSPQHECRHYDGDVYNNHIDNLIWGTRFENVQDCIRHGRFPKGDGLPKLTHDAVRDIRTSGLSNAELAKRYGVSICCIVMARNRRSWKDVA